MITILAGDCRQTLKTIAADSVHCCVTSPPYWGLRDYGHADQIGLEATPDQYVASMVEVFREVRRVLRPDGVCWLNLGDSYAASSNTGGTNSIQGTAKRIGAMTSKGHGIPTGLKPKDIVGIPWRVAFALQADGWWLRQDIIWAKPNPMPESVTDRCTKAHEYVFLLAKSATYWYDAEAVKEAQKECTTERYKYGWNGIDDDGSNGARTGSAYKKMKAGANMGDAMGGNGKRNKRSVWTVATQPYGGAHFATFPPALIEPMILAGCPAKCCPACGAGWERVIVKGKSMWESRKARGETMRNGLKTNQRTAVSGAKSMSGPELAEWKRKNPDITTGWRPTCTCNEMACGSTDDPAYYPHPPIPGTVLDPFGGSGTTAAVATGNGRRAIICELNPEYLKLADERIGMPLFNEDAQ